MRYVLGIDQGGSKTHAIIVNENGQIIGLGKSRGACHSSTGLEDAIQAVKEAADSAFAQSGIGREEVTVITAGMTGVDWAYEAELLSKALEECFQTGGVTVVNDCIIAMRAGTSSENCGILCAGSGLNCAVKKGKELFTYGFYIADEYQGGASLGIKTIQAVFDSHMGLIPQTSLTGRILEYFHCKSVDEVLYRKVKGDIGTRDYLRIPILLEQAAAEKDEVALTIWKEYGIAIARYLTARMATMDMLESEADIILSGSIFKCRIPEFIDTVKKEILNKAIKVNMIEAAYEPIVGAALLGLDELLGEIPEAVNLEIERAAGKFPITRLKSN